MLYNEFLFSVSADIPGFPPHFVLVFVSCGETAFNHICQRRPKLGFVSPKLFKDQQLLSDCDRRDIDELIL